MTGRHGSLVGGLTLALLVLASPAFAAVNCSASLDRTTVSMGEQFVLTVQIEGDVRSIGEPRLPDFGPFEVYGGGQSQRFSYVNGSLHANHSYTYYLRPQKEGEFSLPSITVTADGNEYQTQVLKVRVAPAGSGAGNRASQGARPGRSSGSSGGARGSGADPDEYFVTMTVDADTVVVGQQVVLTFSFYRGVRGSFFDSPQYTPPTTEGFWREDLPPEKHSTLVIRGMSYDVTQIQYAIFPTRAGELEVGEAVVRIPEDRFNSLFRRRRPRGDVFLRAPAIPILVRALPGRAPKDFTGTVAANLKLSMDLDRESLPVGDALTLALTLEGDGYLAAATKPTIPDLYEFNVHDSGSSVDSRPLAGRLQGALRVEKLLIPQKEGRHTIPAIRYPYFDTDQNRYITLTTRPTTIEVTPSDRPAVSSFATGGKTEIEILGQDILHIQPLTGHLGRYAGPLPNRAAYWGLLALGPMAWGASVAAARRRARLRSDPRRLRASRAAKEARERLAGTGIEAQRVSEALMGYVAAKAGRATAGMTRVDVRGWLEGSGASEQTTDSVMEILDRCDQMRFASGDGSSTGLSADAEALLGRLDSEVGRG